MNTITIQFADADDLKWFKTYIEKARASEGTVGGLYTGLLCSALKRATIKERKPKATKP